MSDWKPHPELNWCSECWFNANIESRTTTIGIWWLCLNCATGIHQYNGETVGSLGEKLPCHFEDEEWHKYWEENIEK